MMPYITRTYVKLDGPLRRRMSTVSRALRRK